MGSVEFTELLLGRGVLLGNITIFNGTRNTLQEPDGFSAERSCVFNVWWFYCGYSTENALPIIQHVCVSVFKLLCFQVAVLFVVIGLLH